MFVSKFLTQEIFMHRLCLACRRLVNEATEGGLPLCSVHSSSKLSTSSKFLVFSKFTGVLAFSPSPLERAAYVLRVYVSHVERALHTINYGLYGIRIDTLYSSCMGVVRRSQESW